LDTSPPTGRKDTKISVPSTNNTVQRLSEPQADHNDFESLEKYKAIIREHCHKSANPIRPKFSPYRPKQVISQVYRFHDKQPYVEDGIDDDENGIPVTNLVATKPTPNSPNKLENSPIPSKPPQIGQNSKPSFSVYSDVIIPRNTLRSHVPIWRALQEVGSDLEDSDFGTDTSGTNDTIDTELASINICQISAIPFNFNTY